MERGDRYPQTHTLACSFIRQGCSTCRTIHAVCSLGSLSKEILKLTNSVKHKGNSYYFVNSFFS